MMTKLYLLYGLVVVGLMGDRGVSRLATDVIQRGAYGAEVGAGQPRVVPSGVRRLPALHWRKVMDIVHEHPGSPGVRGHRHRRSSSRRSSPSTR